MKILVGCEESQAVCVAFRELGHEAYSCDLQECSGGHPEWHLQENIFDVMFSKDWEMLIAFPPCTHLAVSGAKHFAKKIADGRQEQGVNFFLALATCDIPKIAIENPVGIMSSKFRKPDQIIQPWQFGDKAQKTTCLWLKNLPLLEPTEIVEKGEFYITPSGKKMASWMCDPIGSNGKKLGYNTDEIKKLRSKTFPGIAKAMATQWSEIK
jgi:site-specific DNA-cytosine methylase